MRATVDIAHAFRSLRRDPGHALPVILVLALGIAATVGVYSIVSGVLLRPLPYAGPDDLVAVWQADPGEGYVYPGSSGPSFRDWQESAGTLESLAATTGPGRSLLAAESGPIAVQRSSVTAGFFGVLGVRPELGRLLVPADGEPGAPGVAVLSYGLWQGRFGGDGNVVGRSITLDDESYDVVGVAGPDVDLPSGTEVWTVLAPESEIMQVRHAHVLGVYGRLGPGQTAARSQAELNAILAGVPGYDVEARVVPLATRLVGDVREPLLILLGAVVLVLLVACANVGTLLLARVARRRRELAVRGALGADPARLIRQLLAESTILALVSGAVGVLAAAWLLDGLVALAPGDLPRVDAISLDGRVLGFALAASLATGLLTGLVPALRSRATAPVADLREDRRSGSRTGRLRGAFVVAEVALSVVLLVAAGLLGRSFLGIVSIDPGFDADAVTSFEVSLPAHLYDGEDAIRSYQERLLAEVQALPVAASAATAMNLPIAGSTMISPALVEGRALDDPPQVEIAAVSPDYFETLGLRLVSGRDFRPGDDRAADPVAVVNAAFVRDYLDGEDAVGRRARTYFGEEMREIVGVVETATHGTLTEDPQPKFYYPAAQMPSAAFHLVVRSDAGEMAVIEGVRAAAGRVDPGVPLGEIATLRELLARTTARPRFYATMLGVFAGLALVLSLTGFFAVLSQAVTGRTREIGIRLAVGAEPGEILGLVFRDGARLTGLGLAIGIATALLAARLLRGLLYGVGTVDPVTLGAVILLLVAASAVATWLPARRAATTDPTRALRSE